MTCPPLDTPRLHLRAATVADAGEVYAGWATDTVVTRFLTWPPHPDVGVTRTFLRTCEADNAGDDSYTWMARRRDDGRLVGSVALRMHAPRASLGYVVAKPFWGQGLCTEMAGAVVDWALARPDIWRVWATCDVDNPASARVLEKLGMEFEGVLKRWIVHPNVSAEPRDSRCYARVRPA